MGTGKQYDEEFKKQAIKLAKEIGTKAAADELCIPKGTLGTWVQKARIGEIDTGAGSRTPGKSLMDVAQLYPYHCSFFRHQQHMHCFFRQQYHFHLDLPKVYLG